VKAGNQTLVFPNASHDISIQTSSLFLHFPNKAHVLLKAFSIKGGELPEGCSVGIGVRYPQLLIHSSVFFKTHRVDHNPLNLDIENTFQGANKWHYAFKPPSKEMTWKQTKEFCANSVHGTPLLYSSDTELTELSILLKRKSQMIATGFQKEVNVSINCIVS